MIKAGIVGLGWWGKTLVESAENSDVIRFVGTPGRSRRKSKPSPSKKACT